MSLFSLVPKENGPVVDQFSPPKAIQACISCRKQKRKCDKTLPACSLCTRMGRSCDYTGDGQPAPTADDLAVLQSRLAELENRLGAASTTPAGAAAVNERSPPSNNSAGGGGGGGGYSPPESSNNNNNSGPSSRPSVNSRGPLWLPSMSRFPSAIFLDIDCFKWATMPIPKPNVDVPADVYEILARGNAVQDAAAEYFSTVHSWFPIVSKKRMTLGISLWEGGPDLAMLFLAMKLITSLPVEGVEAAASPLYTASKRFLALLESSGTLSLLHLQAMILVALYEYGHAIYPAAWMTVAQCARYVEIVGLPSFKESSVMLGSCKSDEGSGGGVYILDRIISLGNKNRFSAPEPEDNYLLPVDDKIWVSMLISAVTNHCRTSIALYRRGTPKPLNLGEVQGLIETLSSFGTILQTELTTTTSPSSGLGSAGPTPSSGGGGGGGGESNIAPLSLLAPRCLVSSALVMLLDAYACPESLRDGCGPGGLDHPGATSPDELVMQSTAVSGLRDVSLAVRDLCLDVLEATMLPPAQRSVSPLCLDALYGAMASLHWLWKEGGDPGIKDALEDVKRCMSHLGMRWRLAGEYTDMVKHHDVTTLMAWRVSN
ncbi:hypothetical protein B0H63DRAFT_460785 [Podospora didyma]|uniref:Zn(2)-C6 fungal-type domain-containing protein n=1 Tax=Podospora didyma TaxID=330526 RepID=A0AAE0U866_9PEZI|nr:hypothetical protein B0H63DRAFT_460785 [Podospora didyma]